MPFANKREFRMAGPSGCGLAGNYLTQFVKLLKTPWRELGLYLAASETLKVLGSVRT